jgi:SAM-dependent methyltransferase
MDGQIQHPMLPKTTHDEQARQLFVKDLREHLATHVTPGNRDVFEHRVAPKFAVQHGRQPQGLDEVRTALSADGYYQFWTALMRSGQELIWDSVIDSVERQLPELTALADDYAQRRPAGGSLSLDPAFETPDYISAADIHIMPGGYHEQNQGDGISQGAIYDRGLYLYLTGNGGAYNEGLGRVLAGCIQRDFKRLNPQRILDVGCGAGNPTLAIVEAFPEAEVHGLDVAAPMLRYGHARAESLGRRVHFHQKNAENTGFADGAFDLIVSCLFMHETSRAALPRIFKECHRLLRPGGVLAFLDVPNRLNVDALQLVVLEWEGHNNNENFGPTFRNLNIPPLVIEAGFPPENVKSPGLKMPDNARSKNYQAGGEILWTYLTAVKAA